MLVAEIERRRPPARVVLTNGWFDLLHLGHARVLEHAASLGDLLIVGINDDDSVRSMKSTERPLTPAGDRAEMIGALACVDYVVIFPERTAERLVHALRPDVYVKGGDYDESELPEAAVVRRLGGEVVLAPLLPGRSTSELLQRIRAIESRG